MFRRDARGKKDPAGVEVRESDRLDRAPGANLVGSISCFVMIKTYEFVRAALDPDVAEGRTGCGPFKPPLRGVNFGTFVLIEFRSFHENVF